MLDSILQWNLSIDFNAKNNSKNDAKKKPVRGRTQNGRKNGPKRADLDSDAWLRHLSESKYADIDDPRKLIKKGEKPVKIGSLMGAEQVGQCLFIEYENDMIIVDAGMEFAPKEAFGADYIIPDINYVKRNIKKLRGIVITHGHLDHVGALRDLLPDLWYPTIYTTPLSLGIIKKTFDDPKDAEKVKYKIVDPDVDIIKLGCFTLEFVPVNHNIPETMALAINTPKGLIFDSADFKIDHTPAIDRPADLGKIARIGTEGVNLYIGDSLGANKKGRSLSELEVGNHLDNIIKNVEGRLIIASFASNVGRIIQIINSAVKYDKVVFLSGRSMVNNVEICQKLGYINTPKGYVRKLSSEIDSIDDKRVIVLSTGAQGEEFAALTRIARGDHNIIQLRKGDTIMRSATTIPGNEGDVNKMLNDLVIKDINIITNDDVDIHASGHGNEEDHKLMLSLLRPKFFFPYFMPAVERYAHRALGLKMGIPDNHIIMPEKNGHIIEMYDDVTLVGKETLKLDTILVDGKGKWHLSGEYVIKAREIMAGDGVLNLIFKVDTKSKQLVGNIQIESRGFVYSSEVKEIHTKIVEFARAKYNENLKKNKDVKFNLKMIKESLGEFLTKVIDRVPMIIPSFVYINKETKEAMTKDDAIVGMTLEEQGYDE